MRLTAAKMYGRMLASDAAYDGQFFTGVLTTGIYCLPSCGARKPRRENVTFFPTCEAARAAGLRPCKKCHPDDYARGADPVLQDVEMLVGEIRRQPEAFADARAVVRRSGFGASRLFELLRRHFHATPADLLIHARLEAAKTRLLRKPTRGQEEEAIAAVGFAVGFESSSAFHDRFRELNGLTPAAYRELRSTSRFTVQLPEDYPLPYLRRALGRDPQSVSERLTGDRYVAAVRTPTRGLRLELQLAPAHVEVSAQVLHEDSAASNRAPVGVEAHRIVVGLLGLGQDAAGFARLAQRLGLGRLVEGRPGLRLSQVPSTYDALLWAVIGQQINLPFACTLRRRLYELAGERIDDGLVLPPAPATVGGLDPASLRPLQFSGPKAETVIRLSQQVADGSIDLDALRQTSATRVERTLLAVRGLGPWSVNYLMMRALGFADCVPYGDTGVTSGLQRLFDLEQRPDIDATRRLMAVFAPYRTLATAHLWQIHQPLAT